MQSTPNPGSAHSTLRDPIAAGGSRWPSEDIGWSNGGLGEPYSSQWASRDPRASSTQSLVSSMGSVEDGRKRRLLAVYIHGYMGDRSSFRSFPAHVHSFLKDLLAESHVIHTKIYPRYKTYKSIDVARDNFSNWLMPHESPTTDVVLIGHSMGGLLAAEVVLLPNQDPYNASYPFRHRILGTISLDAPLLGLHPGIVVSGIASLFRPAPGPPLADEGAQDEYVTPSQPQNIPPDPSTYSDVSPPPGALSPALSPTPSSSAVSSSALDSPDPYFDPAFFNDVAFIDRGWLGNIFHFANKHKQENLFRAAANHILSHLEFNACLADYPGLKSRYNRLRALEDIDDWRLPESGQRPARVRFVNYYTVSTGIPKRPRPAPPCRSPSSPDAPGSHDKSPPGSSLDVDPGLSTPRISVEMYSDGPRWDCLQVLEPMPEPEHPEPPRDTQPPSETPDSDQTTAADHPLDNTANQSPDLPSIPDLPNPPIPPDLDTTPDKEAREQAKKAFKLAQKAYSQAVKARNKAIKDHQKALDKQQRKAAKELKDKQPPQKLHKSPPPPDSNDDLEENNNQGSREQKEKKSKRRKFCMLPPKSPTTGERDPAWVEVSMEGVDEVGAHCGLFLPGPHYERLVGDVGERIAGWAWEDASRRVALGLEGMEIGITDREGS
ncbi:hypothetical protein C8A03DRAFT_29554 [Achaetomium macrosporum]|uniref:DUF676 domain-containing protein n=1 Tax=Achaetomium macrosporum TaxID=79813 RepID=A0AAN7CIK3_9PEZI|nr:hypothetical protein C8A03DRAFT_29554 [Achaetomium macrosporum]